MLFGFRLLKFGTNLSHIRDERGKTAAANGRRPHPTSRKQRKSPQGRWRSGLRSGLVNLCRALGLGLLPSLFAVDGNEVAKVAVHKNRLTSVLRALVHFVPVGGAVALIALNCRQFYIGPWLKNISLLQFAAKLHELTIQASLTTILLTYIRYELALGVGLPFGALFSGLQITQISYLWSLEFWGSISASKIPIRQRLCFLMMALITILLAATVGPASALAMIPRLENWPAGRTYIWLNGSVEDIWPSFIDASGIPVSCSRVESDALINSCPSSRWRALADSNLLGSGDLSGQPGSNWAANSINDTLLSSQQAAFEIRNNNSYSTVATCGAEITGVSCIHTLATMQQATVSDALVTVEQLWTSAAGNSIRDSGARNISHSTQALQPFTAVQCLTDTIFGRNDTTPIYFPNFFNPFGVPNLPQNLSYKGWTKPELANTFRNTTELSVVFVDLVEPEFSPATTGAIVLIPIGPKFLWFLQTCHIRSGWGISDVTGSGDVLSSYVTTGSDFSAPPYAEQVRLDSQGNYIVTPYTFQDFPLKPIRVSSEWASYLNPFVVDFNTTVFNTICNMGVCDVERTLGLMMTNGLALTGGSRGLEGNISLVPQGQGVFAVDGGKWLRGEDIFVIDPEQSKHWVRLEVKTQVMGLVYATIGLPIKLAVVILATYIALALSHFIYACVSGFSSASWGSVSEVTALAINSPPSEDLDNTCAGIEAIGIFRLPVRILAAGGRASGAETDAPLQCLPTNGGHLELVFGEVGREAASRNRIAANKKYGTLRTEC